MTSNTTKIEEKIKKFEEIEKIIQNYDKKVASNNDSSNNIDYEKKVETLKKVNSKRKVPKVANSVIAEKKTVKNKPDAKKSKEEIENEKELKLKERRKIYKKLNQKTRRGQPVMKNKIEHLFNKIKNSMKN